MIPCAFPQAQYQNQRDEILDAVVRVLDSGNYILGPEVSAFEDRFASYCGVSRAVGVNSGTDALILSLKALGVGAGDEVVTVSLTAIATISAIIAVGATPVLVDVDPLFYTLNPARLEEALTERTKAVVVVHLYGQPADMDAILAIADPKGIAVVEDCAQATGGKYNGKTLGGIGDVGCFSFYPTKNLGAIGDGGAVVTSVDELAERVGRLRQYGWDKARRTTEPGVNSRLDEMQAAILNVKLPMLESSNKRRIDIANRYDSGLKHLPIQLPVVRPNATHVYHLYVISLEDRGGLINYLEKNSIFAGIHYPVAGHLHGGYRDLVRLSSDMSVTETLTRKILSLPLYPELTEVQVDNVIDAVCSYF